jgi:organic hydroperoxide reductase OsmC/OhrA
MKKHFYTTTLEWTGNKGTGTENYRSYDRNHTVHIEGKIHRIMGSSDPSFLGDASRYNPEELFLSSLSTCHMLWYLHLWTCNKKVDN